MLCIHPHTSLVFSGEIPQEDSSFYVFLHSSHCHWLPWYVKMGRNVP